MIFFYDESVWREPLLLFCGWKIHIISVLFLVCFCWVSEVSDKECREVRPDYGYVLVGKPCQKQCGAPFCWFTMVILMQEHHWNFLDST